MKKRKIYYAFSLVFLILIVYISTLTYDYNLALKGNRPICAMKTVIYKDGGTTVYIGFGYKIIDYNEMTGRDDIQFISPFFNKSIKNQSLR